MRFHILTLFPDFFRGPLEESILGRAAARGLVRVRVHNIRDYAQDRHRVTDDYPFGGGSGMVMKPEPLFRAVEAVQRGIAGEAGEEAARRAPVVLLTPQGRPFRQDAAQEMAGYEDLILVCGHYEGVDERVREHLATDEVSIGDYVLTGGEPAALVVADAVARLVPGVVGDPESLVSESHTTGLLEYPQYTRPRSFRGWDVPDMLLSGNHAEIARWRRRQALLRTLRRRPELLAGAWLSEEDRRFLAQHGYHAPQTETSPEAGEED